MSKKKRHSLFEVVSRNPDGSISISKGGRIAQRGASNTKIAPFRKKRAVALIKMNSEISEGRLIFDLPLQTVSEANCFEHWTKKHERHTSQKWMIVTAFKPHLNKMKLPCKIMLTRFAPDALDKFENLPMSFKYIVDAICSIITGDYRPGRADSDKRIELACDQVKNKEYGIRIEITF